MDKRMEEITMTALPYRQVYLDFHTFYHKIAM